MRPTFIARPAALCRALVLALIIGAVTASTVAAHFNGTANRSISSAVGPIGAGVTYSGRFGGDGDVDYYYFVTTRDNVSLHFSIRNTLSSCKGGGNCQIYATLVSTAGQQLGGEGSGAGTGPVGYAGGCRRHSSREDSPISRDIMARKYGPPDQWFTAGLSKADAVATTIAGPATSSHIPDLTAPEAAARSDRAPAQTHPAPSTVRTFPSGLAHTWWTVPFSR